MRLIGKAAMQMADSHDLAGHRLHHALDIVSGDNEGPLGESLLLQLDGAGEK